MFKYILRVVLFVHPKIDNFLDNFLLQQKKGERREEKVRI
jgi:hypothetical protein